MSFGHRFVLSICLLLASFSNAESQTRTRRNFYGIHNLKDGGAAIPEGMNWTRHLVGDGGGTVDSSIQAAYLENVYRLAESGYAGRVDRVFWFCWSDGMVPPFGVVTATGAAKPAYWSYRAVAPP